MTDQETEPTPPLDLFWGNGQNIASSSPKTSSKKRGPSKGYPSPRGKNRRAEGAEHRNGRDA